MSDLVVLRIGFYVSVFVLSFRLGCHFLCISV